MQVFLLYSVLTALWKNAVVGEQLMVTVKFRYFPINNRDIN
jgi:hypothetical protein